MRSLYLLLVYCLMLTACSSGSTANPAAGPEHDHKPSLDVKLEVVKNQVTVKFDTDIKISAEHYGQGRAPGEGHIHMYLDNGEKMMLQQRETALKNLAAGTHTLKVSLHNNDHTPYDVTKTVSFEIK